MDGAESRTYTDEERGFALDYPSRFVFEDQTPPGGFSDGTIQGGRFVEERFREGFPPGQIELVIRQFDRPPLTEWLSYHDADHDGRYFSAWTFGDFESRVVMGREAQTADWLSDDGTKGRAVFWVLDQQVVSISYFWHEDGYRPHIHDVYEEILASVRQVGRAS